MIINIGGYTLDADVEATKRGYTALPLIIDDCACPDCENYFRAADALPDAVKRFFDLLGADVKRSPEVFGLCYYGDRQELYYGGFYHIAGRIVDQRETLYIQTGKKTWAQNPKMVVHITDKFAVWFTDDCSLVSAGFPEPHFQMEIAAYINGSEQLYNRSKLFVALRKWIGVYPVPV